MFYFVVVACSDACERGDQKTRATTGNQISWYIILGCVKIQKVHKRHAAAASHTHERDAHTRRNKSGL